MTGEGSGQAQPGATPSRSGATLDVLSPEECLSLLATRQVGRVAVSRPGHGPLVVPVNFVLDGEAVVFRSGLGTTLEEVHAGSVMSFQADEIDPFHHVGWSVLVEGSASEVPDEQDQGLDPTPWAPGDRPHWVRLAAREVSGRRIRLLQAEPDQRGYR